ncbi:MAG: ABC transporter ATP-binding protein [Desulfobulbus sp.]|nr:ABC transporter ATP-binding protein [Desulfobulbus sp.]
MKNSVPMEIKQPLLHILDLGHRYSPGEQEKTVLRGLHGRVYQGELVCLIGRSGCGKSTLLKILAGFFPPSEGQCLLGGKPITRPGPDRGVVFQEDALFPWLTVRENITFGLKNSGTLAQSVMDMLEQVGLQDYGEHLPRALSGGMKQRVALARVLIRSPRILLMDEPFGALDAQTREEMQELLLRLMQDRQQTVIFVTHDVQEAVTLADRVWLMDRGDGAISRDLAVSLPRPRDPGLAQFQDHCRQLHYWLRQHPL